MKKIIYLVLFTTIILSTTACSGEKTLVCTKNLDSDGAKILNTNTLTFKNDKIKVMEMEYNYELDEEYVKNAESIKSNIDKQFSEYTKYEGVNYTSTLTNENKKIKYTIQINIDKIDDEGKKAFNITGDESYDANKLSLKEAGFNCK